MDNTWWEWGKAFRGEIAVKKIGAGAIS
jgi:hypothetical protein